ncbi:hypothetical protein BUALT_Bualt03G0151500 [Buddleja alternifolia]|uniref:Chaoptin n=1 Tax=Buddleja alternifolia TaxID=168488 RepID=A0AAV6XY85_9LAMI|nr:hypothetical protein BUALT_Bualt03G0151500 [Buddleja alternifolia]
MWKGVESEYKRILGLVKFIDLSSNKLTGEIPNEITSLVGLVSLNLSRNFITGSIPPQIGRLHLLDYLDLSRNKLSGVIPRSLAQLNYIGVLDLSYNNLSGRIPSSTQLQSFNVSAYTGNSGLCGPPVTENCLEDKVILNPEVTDNEEDTFITPVTFLPLSLILCSGSREGRGSSPLASYKRLELFLSASYDFKTLMLSPEHYLHKLSEIV